MSVNIIREDCEHNYVFKYIIVGDSTAGKSSIMRRLIDGSFDITSPSTIGVEYGSIFVELQKNNEPILCKVQLWDTAGQERYKAIVNSYFRGSTGIILAFDISNRTTFDNIEMWYDEIKKKHHTLDKASVILVGNKADLENKRQVSIDDAKALAAKLRIPYMETSAKQNSGILEMISYLTMDIYDRIIGGKIDLNENGLSIRYIETGFQYDTKPVNRGCCY